MQSRRPWAGEQLAAVYSLKVTNEDDATKLAEWLCYEQTVELPPGCVPASLANRCCGKVLELRPRAGGVSWETVISYPREIFDGNPSQLMTVLFGNASLIESVALVDVLLPEWMDSVLPGPAWGGGGLRGECERPHGPLLVAAAKPLGLSCEELAEVARSLVDGGVDVVKDDHGFSNQLWCPFNERVSRVLDAVLDAASKRGRPALYVPSLPADPAKLPQRMEELKRLGISWVMVQPALSGLDMVRWLSSQGFGVVGHPAMIHTRISPHLMLGTLFRGSGCDAVIFPGPGSRFPQFTMGVCRRIVDELTVASPWRRAMPVLAGGLDEAKIRRLMARFGSDVSFLVGADILCAEDPRGKASRLREILDAAANHQKRGR